MSTNSLRPNTHAHRHIWSAHLPFPCTDCITCLPVSAQRGYVGGGGGGEILRVHVSELGTYGAAADSRSNIGPHSSDRSLAHTYAHTQTSALARIRVTSGDRKFATHVTSYVFCANGDVLSVARALRRVRTSVNNTGKYWRTRARTEILRTRHNVNGF